MVSYQKHSIIELSKKGSGESCQALSAPDHRALRKQVLEKSSDLQKLGIGEATCVTRSGLGKRRSPTQELTELVQQEKER